LLASDTLGVVCKVAKVTCVTRCLGATGVHVSSWNTISAFAGDWIDPVPALVALEKPHFETNIRAQSTGTLGNGLGIICSFELKPAGNSKPLFFVCLIIIIVELLLKKNCHLSWM
jgi:hypothetical protein